MDNTSNIRVVQAFLAALERMDADAALVLLTPDVVYQNIPFPEDRGQDAVKRTLDRLNRVLTEFKAITHHIAQNGPVVLTDRTDILRGPWLDLSIGVHGTFELRDGKIAVWRDRFDVASVALQALTSPFRRLFARRSAA
jgi:limonene-1,2-epoxide hydrolase